MIFRNFEERDIPFIQIGYCSAVKNVFSAVFETYRKVRLV